MQKYKTLKTLGDGAFGTVYKATNVKTGEVVAIKKMKQKYTNWNQCIELRQVKSLRKLNHPNVMKLKEVLLVSDQLYMVFQYLEYNLYEVYAKMKQQKKSFTEYQIKCMVYQIANGLAHMHKSGFFHRDMKPENLLIYNNIVKLCDFGLAREIRSRPPFTDYVSTRWYRAPELLLRSTSYNSPVDIFALGCIMAQLYTLTPLFPGTNQVDQMNKIVKVLGTPDKNDWPEGYKLAQSKGYYFPTQSGVNLGQLIPQASSQALDLIQSMLHYSSRKRPTATEILKHDFFKGVKLPDLQSEGKDVVFQEQPQGAKLDTNKQDKKIDEFRTTKQKFKQTRRHDAQQNNPFKQHEFRKSKLFDKKQYTPQFNNNSKGADNDDLDSLIKQLQEKGKKKKDDKLPSLPTKQKFYNYNREFRKDAVSTQPLKYLQPDQNKGAKSEDVLMRKKESSYNNKNTYQSSRSVIETSKFSYSFQPSIVNNVFMPVAKSPYKTGGVLGYPLISKQKSLISGPVYKY